MGADIAWDSHSNIQPPPERLLPINGVYATLGRINGEWLPSVTNVGFSPTFKKG
jgi:FAD synthase